MITEDYVSFETAKLLKEKGFDECTICSFDKDGNPKDTLTPFVVSDGDVRRPTLQMAMKWLWEKHKKHVEPAMTIERLGFTFLNKWHCFVMSVDNKNQTDLKCVGEDFSSYEEACEFGIKYCLKMIFV